METIIGMSAGLLTTLAFLPQAIKIFRTKHTKDLSLLTFSVFSIGVCLWLIYGLMVGAMPIILANSVTIVLALAIVIMKLKYG